MSARDPKWVATHLLRNTASVDNPVSQGFAKIIITSKEMSEVFNVSAPRPILTKLLSRRKEYTESLPLRVAVGTYNINGGKHFRSIVYKDVSLSDWLLDAHKSQKIHGSIFSS